MRSKNRIVQVSKAINIGSMPVFIRMMHRHLEKEQPPVLAVTHVGETEFEVPVDLLRLTLSDKTLADGVDSVTLAYKQSE